jgi:hypothetical protein
MWKTTGKDSSEAYAITCQNCTVYSVLPSGMKSHSKIAQFNWESIGRFTFESTQPTFFHLFPSIAWDVITASSYIWTRPINLISTFPSTKQCWVAWPLNISGYEVLAVQANALIRQPVFEGNVLKCLRVAGISNVKQLVVRSNSVTRSLYNLQRRNPRPDIRERWCHAPLQLMVPENPGKWLCAELNLSTRTCKRVYHCHHFRGLAFCFFFL